MQVVEPIDIEEALAAELAARIPSAGAHAAPAPDGMAAGTVVVQALGASQQTEGSDLYDVVAYCYSDTYAGAMALGTVVSGAIRAIQAFGPVAGGVEWTTTGASAPYDDPDPDRPTLRRATVRATVGARGIPIQQ